MKLPLLLLVGAVTGQAAGQGSTPSATAIAHLVDQRYNHMQSLRARYTERYRGMGMDRTESGTLTLRKPGRMRWAYDTPAGKVFLLDGKTAVSYTPGDAEAQKLAASKLDDLHSPLRFLLGHTSLARELEGLSIAPVQLSSGQSGYTLSGTPKGMTNRVHTLLITVDPQGRIYQLRIVEPDDAETTFDFTNLQENVDTNDAEFRFVPPPGVTVVAAPNPI